MKIKNKKILITLVSALILISAIYVISVKGVVTAGEVSGYLILIDQKITYEDYAFLRDKKFYTIIYLPSENCEGVVNYCSYAYKEGVNSQADINNDGKIDITDLQVAAKAFGCDSGNKCWSEPIEECFFEIKGRKFKDPTRDCKMDQSDLDLVSKYFGNTTNPLDANCENDEKCRADMNKDGKIDLLDLVIVASKFNSTYADSFERVVEHKSRADMNNDSKIDISDLVIVAGSFGEEAIEQKCISSPIDQISGKKYAVSASGKGLYYAGVSYRCTL
jgi:Ca2+-binding EF-hand superfamily protein